MIGVHTFKLSVKGSPVLVQLSVLLEQYLEF